MPVPIDNDETKSNSAKAHGSTACDPIAAKIAAVARRIEECVDAGAGELSLTALAERARMSAFALQRAFKRVMGVTPHQYATGRKLERFRTRLLQGEDVTTATYAAGFGSSSRVYEKTAARFGLRPKAYARGGAAEAIAFAVTESPVGLMLVAATERGVCSIAFGESGRELEAELRKSFKRATITRAEGALAEAVAAILAQMREHPAALKLPLDVRATAFQQRVWAALMAIPRGETRSYAEIARVLKQPTAARAVARAIASNPVAVAIPCHRVIGSDGKLTGYRWGVERKRRLLELESCADGGWPASQAKARMRP